MSCVEMNIDLLDGLLAVLLNRIDQGLEIKAPLGGERSLEAARLRASGGKCAHTR